MILQGGRTIVIDEDTTTLSHLRKEYDASIEKWSDVSHARKKIFTTMHYNMSKKYKILTANKNKLINYTRNFF